MSTGLIRPVNSMQMFHQTAANRNNMYLVHADCIGGGRSRRAGNKEEPPPFLLCYLDLLEGPRHTADGPLPSGRDSPSPQPQEYSCFQQQTLKSACISHMGMYKFAAAKAELRAGVQRNCGLGSRLPSLAFSGIARSWPASTPWGSQTCRGSCISAEVHSWS